MPNPDFLDQAFTRTADAALVPGNRVRLLKDAQENYPAWLEAIAGAQRTVLFENYMFCEDEIGLEFQRALTARARAGVRVRVIYDWLGSFGRASQRYWRALRAAGVEVRCFNRPRFAAPFGALHRDHRKMLAVDGCIGFVTGLCIGRMWAGDPQRGIAPWRDTGIELRGPVLRDIEKAFAQVWVATGAPLPDDDRAAADSEPGNLEIMDTGGTVAVRIVASAPGLAAVLRLEQLVAAAARRSLWLTDAYFAGIPTYVQALRSAARDGVDVRLLVPGASDIAVLRPLSEVGYRPLLEAGVRVFEWKGSMLHAKTAVADGRWARVGSSNLNVASWMGNFELDAMVEDEGFAAAMERMYVADLAQAREIVLRRRRLRLRVGRRMHRPHRFMRARETPRVDRGGSASRAAAGALRIGRTVGAALSEQRVLAPTEARLVAAFGGVALVAAALAVRWPLLAAVPVAILLAWISFALFCKALALRRERRRRGLPATRLARAPIPDSGPDAGEPEDQSGGLPPRARNS
ncbi:MAG TPA: phospholipase D-like domain-containing protein [Steroidobacteraceae bacterium]|nr:phospholipase D-like domain-containing protein [Steroidobacteraceae bacterium]